MPTPRAAGTLCHEVAWGRAVSQGLSHHEPTWVGAFLQDVNMPRCPLSSDGFFVEGRGLGGGKPEQKKAWLGLPGFGKDS